MIEVTIDRGSLRTIERKLGDMENRAPTVLKNAINQTARQARKRLGAEAQKTYTVKNAGFNRAMKIKNATASEPEAIINAKGEPIPLKNFKISKAGGVAKAQVLKSGTLKPLQIAGLKAFVNNVAKKGQVRKRDTQKGQKGTQVTHVAVAQRKGAARLPIKTFYGNSVPMMIGNEKRVYGIVKPEIEKMVQENVEKQIRKVLEG